MGFSQRMEWRQFGRRWTNVHGWAHVDERPRAPCIVKNVSEGGALLQIDPALRLPNAFTLVIDALAVEISCEIRHQRQGAIGVRFTSEGGRRVADAIAAASVPPARPDDEPIRSRVPQLGDAA